jgi:hypothetical protein
MSLKKQSKPSNINNLPKEPPVKFFKKEITFDGGDAEPLPARKSEKMRIKWADDLVEVKTFKKLPTKKRIENLIEKAKNTTKVCGKSILKRSLSQSPRYENSNDDTSASSSSSIPEIFPQRKIQSGVKHSTRFSCSPPKPISHSSKPSKKQPNYVEELLIARLQRKYNMGSAVSIY